MTRFIALATLALALVSTATSQESSPTFRSVPWAVWGGAGTDFDSYSLSIGARRGAFGLGFGYRYNTSADVPSFTAETRTEGTTDETSYQVSTLGLDLYTMQQVTDGISLYGTVGGYVDINTVLVRETESRQWFLSPKSPDWTHARMEYGGGLEFAVTDWLLAGIGYHSVRGFNIHAGYTW